MPIDVPHLIAARELEDGTFSLEEQRPELAQRIRSGDPTLGWLGDERLSLHASNDAEGVRWEVWRRHEDGSSSLVCHKRGELGTGDSLIRRLASSDARLIDVAGNALGARDDLEAQRKREHLEHAEDKADKLAWALGRDLDIPAQDGRMFPLGSDS